jgi:L-aspartate oxidase
MREDLGAPHSSVPAAHKASQSNNNGQSAETQAFIKKVRSLMWQHVGVVRDGKGLRQVVSELSAMHAPVGDRSAYEAANILEAGLLIARSALAREESRGAHYRLDFPLSKDATFRKHSVVSGEQIRFE